jgi:hypothetical protein
MRFARFRLALIPLIAAATLAATVAVPSPAAAAIVKGDVSCGQHSQAWLVAFGYGVMHSDLPSTTQMTIPHGVPIYHTGIIYPGSVAVFRYLDLNFNPVRTYSSAPAARNCVAPHENAVFPTGDMAGRTFIVFVQYQRWETRVQVAAHLGILHIT